MRCYLTLSACAINFLVGTFMFQTSSCAQDASTIVIMPQEIRYKATGSGAETAVLYGDPTKAGLYVMRLRLPAGAKVLPHIHPEEVRTLTVISGTLYFGFGEKWDESKLKAYPAGTFFSEVPTTPHFVAAKDGEVIFQATGIGPSGFVSKHE
jgi:quercetin dioxygenase-like cupin family protein